MINTLKRWSQAPTFVGDEGKTYRASLINIVMLIGFLLICGVVIANLFDKQTPIRNYLIDLAALGVLSILRVGLAQGRVNNVGFGLVSFGFITSFLVVASEGTVLSPASMCFVLVVIISGILFGVRGLLISVIVSSLAVGSLIVAQNSRLLPASDASVTLSEWIVFTFSLGATGGLAYFAQHISQNAYTRLRAEIQERERAEEELRKLARAVEQSPASVVITKLDGSIDYANPRFSEVTGYSLAEVLGKNPRFLKTDQTALGTHTNMWQTLSAGQEWRGEFVNRRKDGSIYFESAVISPITDLNGVPTHYLAVKEDITARKQTEEQLRNNEARYRSLFEQTHDAVFIFDLQGRQLAANQRAADLFGYSQAEINQLGFLDLFSEQAEPAGLFERLKVEAEIPLSESYFRKKAGKCFPAEMNLELVRDKNGTRTHIQSVIRDISQRKQAEDTLKAANEELQRRVSQVEMLQIELREQALRDPLTGLYNRRFLSDALEREIKRADRELSTLSVIAMDIDYFKRINDTFGHQFGDKVLLAIAVVLKRAARGSDFCCRYGGEEFLLVMPGASTPIAARRAEQIRQKCESYHFSEMGQDFHLTISFGVATYPLHGQALDEILINADMALYESKRAGRNRVTIWNPELNGQVNG